MIERFIHFLRERLVSIFTVIAVALILLQIVASSFLDLLIGGLLVLLLWLALRVLTIGTRTGKSGGTKP
ncbi:hypothetical protein ASC97_05690 [Rhizobium sp. Root1203]|uniref:hypothetical protein n=1 Tax=Rhizobium sp. Root1203 TaxID=1736427 RepID=UPI0007089681|nr:hypothetical protein [Rhizobium sp. Root1203]KQV27856.1 hypothetical protein ASC97_05690 [Rhizobium sp. Root1203]